jgi:hypothetical protein
MKVVAISGWVKSGKDTAAELLISEYGYQRISFAAPLKDNVAKQFGFDRKSLDDQAQKELPLLDMPVYAKDGFSKNLATFMFREFRDAGGRRPSAYTLTEDGKLYSAEPDKMPMPLYWTRRALMILEGSAKRTADPDYWVSRAVKNARETGTPLVVISDLRYKNEMSALKMALGAEDDLVTVRVNRFDDTESKDPSERDLDDAKFDIVIENRGTLDEFLDKVAEINTFGANA